MKRNFVKMHGCGNDYIYFDCFEEALPNPEEVSRKLSRYHFGIGGDGVILIEPSEKADGRMRIFNQDGSEERCAGMESAVWANTYMTVEGYAKKP